MSTEKAVQFLEDAWANEELREKLQSQENVTEIMAVANEAGYEFTEDEFYEANLEIVDRYDIELSEEALEAAAGGVIVVVASNCGQSGSCHGGCHSQEVQ